MPTASKRRTASPRGRAHSRTTSRKRKPAKPTAKRHLRSVRTGSPGKLKEACLVFFYTGDSYVVRLAQETIKLNKYLKGYKKTVLLKHTNKIGGIDLTGIAKRQADIYDKPTKANFTKYIKQLAQEGYQIDIFIIGHGNPKKFVVSTGKNGSKGYIDTKYLKEQLSEKKTGFKKLPIRLVYQGICFGETWNKTWRSLGAKCSVGAKHVNFYPNQMGRFLSEWNKGKTVASALKKSNTAASRTVVQSMYILPDALATRKKWGGCPFGKTVLGKHPCAKKYFGKMWGMTGAQYKASKSGKANMNASSKMITAGSPSITRKTMLSATHVTATRHTYSVRYRAAA